MNPRLFRRALLPLLALALLASRAAADDAKSTKGFREAIIKMSPTIDPAEAELIARTGASIFSRSREGS